MFKIFEIFTIFFKFLSEKLAISVVNWFEKNFERVILAYPGWPIRMADGSILILRMDGWMDAIHPSILPSEWIWFLTLHRSQLFEKLNNASVESTYIVSHIRDSHYGEIFKTKPWAPYVSPIDYSRIWPIQFAKYSIE